MYHYDASLLLMQPIPHARHDVRYEGEWGRVVVRKRVVVDAAVDLRVWVARPFCAELPYCPVVAVLRVEKLYEGVKRVAVRALGIGAAGARSRND